jgi:FkbM family methyltransferase
MVENYFEEAAISIATKEINGVTLYGIERDITYEAMIANEFREPHFKIISDLILQEDDNCLDLGANFGSHSLVMSNICKRGLIYAFEPQSVVFQCLTLNVHINKIRNVRLFNLAVDQITGRELGIEQIRTSSELVNSGYSRLVDSSLSNKVLTIALDDMDLPKIDFVKMDIQGSELSAVKGMKRILHSDQPIIFFEVEKVHLEFRKASSEELFNILNSMGYSIYRIENEYPSDHLAIPAEKRVMFAEKIVNHDIGKIMQKIKIS